MELERIFCLFPRQENGLLNLRARYNLIKINVKIIHQSQVTEQEINACCFITKALGHFWLKQQQKPSISVFFPTLSGQEMWAPSAHAAYCPVVLSPAQLQPEEEDGFLPYRQMTNFQMWMRIR